MCSSRASDFTLSKIPRGPGQSPDHKTPPAQTFDCTATGGTELRDRHPYHAPLTDRTRTVSCIKNNSAQARVPCPLPATANAAYKPREPSK
ncbi:hypothetical protein BOA8489_03658 [Boseongicola aestuarii]|jgi:hypothetical protein|uniref:Uncharacterized protein n=1 Tax=Boseongicola aestuarii TaxID=1470561 RepID=A0A238J6L1_9RHOB|nr:hypothetical protein BOA8489_03658 [Boseongicola aestuarii]